MCRTNEVRVVKRGKGMLYFVSLTTTPEKKCGRTRFRRSKPHA